MDPESRVVKKRILCVDEHSLLRDGISYAINRQPDLIIAGEASSGVEAVTLYPSLLPDLTLVELEMRGVGGIQTVQAIRGRFPRARFVLLTTDPTELTAQQAFVASAEGYLSKHLLRTDLLDTIRIVLDGGHVIPADIAAKLSAFMGVSMLTARELEVIGLLDQDWSHSDIGSSLQIRDELVAAHVKNIIQRLHAHSLQHALTIARNRGYLKPPSQ